MRVFCSFVYPKCLSSHHSLVPWESDIQGSSVIEKSYKWAAALLILKAFISSNHQVIWFYLYTFFRSFRLLVSSQDENFLFCTWAFHIVISNQQYENTTNIFFVLGSKHATPTRDTWKHGTGKSSLNPEGLSSCLRKSSGEWELRPVLFRLEYLATRKTIDDLDPRWLTCWGRRRKLMIR